jgi:hypothetical protein
MPKKPADDKPMAWFLDTTPIQDYVSTFARFLVMIVWECEAQPDFARNNNRARRERRIFHGDWELGLNSI